MSNQPTAGGQARTTSLNVSPAKSADFGERVCEDDLTSSNSKLRGRWSLCVGEPPASPLRRKPPRRSSLNAWHSARAAWIISGDTAHRHTRTVSDPRPQRAGGGTWRPLRTGWQTVDLLHQIRVVLHEEPARERTVSRESCHRPSRPLSPPSPRAEPRARRDGDAPWVIADV